MEKDPAVLNLLIGKSPALTLHFELLSYTVLKTLSAKNFVVQLQYHKKQKESGFRRGHPLCEAPPI